MNKVIIDGRLTNDPVVRITNQGHTVCSFDIANTEHLKEGKERVDFFKITAWRKLGEICGNNLTKGRRVLIEGKLANEKYEKDGQKYKATKVTAINVEFLDYKKKEDGEENPFGGQVMSDEEDIPFK